ncbi:hypothetical protein RvY_11345 [Ramazzottius varieornatus]|uniref:Uncharacterized protein n=1 Tax=Ramazzottius varieornatus TaxID=947166 RepID=A0A1D1VI83_RAMVA|nr:hypothetical protein RvY_11345 [Ramazzottius varieornatus]
MEHFITWIMCHIKNSPFYFVTVGQKRIKNVLINYENSETHQSNDFKSTSAGTWLIPMIETESSPAFDNGQIRRLTCRPTICNAGVLCYDPILTGQSCGKYDFLTENQIPIIIRRLF